MRKLDKDQFFILSIVSFVASLFFEAFDTSASNFKTGLECLVLGWLGMIYGVGFEWVANPLLFLAWIFWVKKLRVEAILTSAGATIVMLSFLRSHSIAIDEGGSLHPIMVVGPGFWLWVASAILMLVGSLFREVKTDEVNDSKSSIT